MRAALQLLALIVGVVWAAAPLPAAKSDTKKATPKPRGGFSGATPKPAASSTAKPFVATGPSKASATPRKTGATPPPKSSPAARTSAKKNQAAAAEDDPPAGATRPPAQSAATKAVTSKKKTAATPKPEETAAAEDLPGKSSASAESVPDAKAPAVATNEIALRTDGRAPNATIRSEDLLEFAGQPPRVQQLIEGALDLTRQQLTYAYGSADPSKGGMDCSGTIYYLLRKHGFKDVPRDSPGQYTWARKSSGFRAVVSNSATSFEFDELLPGDLMFWSGTYNIKREMPVTHVMLYLGTQKQGRKRVMFGASDGRTYDGVQRWGVSVFDFKMPRTDTEKPRTDFLGYARIPGLRSDPPPPVAANVSDRDAAPRPSILADASASGAEALPQAEPEKRPAITPKKKAPTNPASRKKTRK
jgi:cell wall-associated NlpC family hydrolase